MQLKKNLDNVFREMGSSPLTLVFKVYLVMFTRNSPLGGGGEFSFMKKVHSGNSGYTVPAFYSFSQREFKKTPERTIILNII